LSKQIEKTRFSFTRSELLTISVLALIFISGLIFQQIKRASEIDRSEISVLGADTLTKTELRTLLREPGIYTTSDSPSLDRTGANSLTSTAKPLQEGDGLLNGSESISDGPTQYSDKQTKDFSNSAAEGGKANNNSLIHLNSASQSELETLPGIGPVLAGRILDWRSKHVRFNRVEDLLLIRGIGKKRFEVLKPLVAVDP